MQASFIELKARRARFGPKRAGARPAKCIRSKPIPCGVPWNTKVPQWAAVLHAGLAGGVCTAPACWPWRLNT
eukprot:5712172-Pyramimonas_sp.AAC.1